LSKEMFPNRIATYVGVQKGLEHKRSRVKMAFQCMCTMGRPAIPT